MQSLSLHSLTYRRHKQHYRRVRGIVVIVDDGEELQWGITLDMSIVQLLRWRYLITNPVATTYLPNAWSRRVQS